MRMWLKAYRKISGHSQLKIAQLAGISQSYYASIEAGNRGGKLPVKTAKKIAEALNFDWTKFYEENQGLSNSKGD